jgi:hypothetical protein
VKAYSRVLHPKLNQQEVGQTVRPKTRHEY